MAYGYIGSIKAKAGRRDEVVSILPSGVDGLREAGCHLFIVGSSNADDDTIWASEVWKSKQHAVVANSKPLLGTNATGTPPNGPRSGSTTRPRRSAASTVALFGCSDNAQPMISRE